MDPGPAPLQFRLLGPVTAVADGRALRLGGNRQRALLALLLLRPGTQQPAGQLADQLWDGRPPPGAATTIRSYVSRLRGVLGTDRIVAGPAGYRLVAAAQDVDAYRFEQLARQGRQALADGAPGLARQRLGTALSLWTGPALADVRDTAALAGEADRLDELRLAAVEDRIEADLALGRAADVVAELQALVRAAPLRERLWRQLALALYRSDRQADALRVLREARATLDRDLGLEPGPALRRLEVAILRHELDVVAPEPGSPLPRPANSFLGRERERAELDGLLAEHRLVTITGLGGSGKTRLALELAAEHRQARTEDVRWVDLTAVNDPQLVVGAVARALQVGEQAGADLADRLLERLRAEERLLVLDNCEHLLDACAQLVATLLSGCPYVRVLATSRAPLAVPGEIDYALEPLPAPDLAAADLSREPAVRLFLDRAGEVRHGLPADSRRLELAALICRELDGLPLAIELAAARAKTLSLAEINARLDDRFRFLRAWRRVTDPRHRTLATAMDWSYDLLGGAERALFARLSVFAGGATLDAVAEVCSTTASDPDDTLDLLARLVDASLVRVQTGEQTGEPTRYRLLETVRQYAAAKLADGDAEVHRRHCCYFLAIAEAANLSIESLGRGPQRHEPVLREQHNLRAALDWAAAADPALAARLVLALENFWITNALAEGERRFAQVLAASAGLDVTTRARLERDHAACLDVLQRFAAAREGYRRSRDLFARAGDEAGTAYLDYRLGLIARSLDGDHAEARRLWRRSLATMRRVGDRVGELQIVGDLGQLDVEDGDPAGLAQIQRAVDMARAIGWWWWVATKLGRLAALHVAAGHTDEADWRARYLLEFAVRTNDRQEQLFALAVLARVAALRGQADRARTLWSAVAAVEDGPGRFGRFDRATVAAAMPPGPLPAPLPLAEAVQVALAG